MIHTDALEVVELVRHRLQGTLWPVGDLRVLNESATCGPMMQALGPPIKVISIQAGKIV